MLISGLLITGGALYTWGRIYQKNQKKIKRNTQDVTYLLSQQIVQKFKDDKSSQSEQ